MSHADSWKNGQHVFDKQLDLNLEYFKTNEYPPHWKNFIELMSAACRMMPNIKKMLDIGCGCGAYFELCRRVFPNLEYTGYDYSKRAVDLAKDYWGCDRFYEKDFWKLQPTDIEDYDIINTDAMFAIMNNADEAVAYLMSLKPKVVLLNRVDMHKGDSNYDVYKAYDEIYTYQFWHNQDKFFAMLKGYNVRQAGNAYLIWL